MNKSLLAGLLAALLALPALAAENSADFEQRKAAVFERLRAAESASHQTRILILQQADACIHAARNLMDYRQCERQEQAQRQAYRDAHQGERQMLRADARQLREEFQQHYRQPSFHQSGSHDPAFVE